MIEQTDLLNELFLNHFLIQPDILIPYFQDHLYPEHQLFKRYTLIRKFEIFYELFNLPVQIVTSLNILSDKMSPYFHDQLHPPQKLFNRTRLFSEPLINLPNLFKHVMILFLLDSQIHLLDFIKPIQNDDPCHQLLHVLRPSLELVHVPDLLHFLLTFVFIEHPFQIVLLINKDHQKYPFNSLPKRTDRLDQQIIPAFDKLECLNIPFQLLIDHPDLFVLINHGDLLVLDILDILDPHDIVYFAAKSKPLILFIFQLLKIIITSSP